MAWNSKEGELKGISNGETYMSCVLNCLNTTFGKTTSYKYGLIKSLLDNLFNINDNYELDFKYLNETFGKIYWNIIVKYSLPQKQMSQQGEYSTIEIIIHDILANNRYVNGVDFDSLNDDVKKDYYKRIRHLIYNKDVVGALYSDLCCKIYGFSKKRKMLYFSKESYEFLVSNKTIIEKLNYYNWIIWVEKILDKKELGINNVALKLDLSTKRKNLDYFKKKLFVDESDKCECFYCNKTIKIKSKQLHLDHFIPWSFVKDDKIWNLVPSCSVCNLKKKDKIPSHLLTVKLFKRNENLLGRSYEDNLIKMRESALRNGFVAWEKLDEGDVKDEL